MSISRVYRHISAVTLAKTEVAHIRNRLISYNIACQRLKWKTVANNMQCKL
jgi:hypothetical protein